jgi:hypothetical protein
MENSEQGCVTTTTYHRSIRWLVDTPTKRRLVFTGIVAVLAALTYVSFRISFELYSPMSCVMKSCFASLHHNHYWWTAAANIFRVSMVSSMVGLIISYVRNLRIVDDVVERYPWKDLTKLRKRLDLGLMWTRRVLSLVTITCFITSFVALMVLVEIAQP